MIFKTFTWLLFVAIAGTGLFSGQAYLKTDTAEEHALIPRELLFGNPQKTSPKLSPSGGKLSYLAPDQNNVLNVWVKDIATADDATVVTTELTRGIRNYFWSYDEESIFYLQDKNGDENWHLYQTNLTSKLTKDLSPYEGARVGIVSYNHDHPEEMLIQMNLRNPELSDVYRLTLATGELKLDTENPGNVIGWVADHSQVVRAANGITDKGTKVIMARASENAPWQTLLEIEPSELGGELVAFTADTEALYLMASLGGDTVRLLQLDIKTGKYHTIAANETYDIEGMIIHPHTHHVEAVEYEGEKYTIQPMDPSFAADFNWLQGKGQFHIVSRDLANKNWLLAMVSDVSPVSYYLYSRDSKTLKFLFTNQPELETYALSPMEPISYTARDGRVLHGYLTLPVGKDRQNLPLVLMVHGGPWARDSWGLDPTVQWLANRGYGVLQINFRGSTGYGKNHLNAGNREWGRKMHSDLLDGKQWAIDLGIACPSKVAIYGGSYGGYATLAALAFTPEEFACGVDVVGPSNLITLMQSLPPYWSPMKAEMALRIGCLDTEPEFLAACSPLFKAHQITKPLLIAQGANDPRVKQTESDQIVQAMRQNHLPVEYLLFPDEGHGFARPSNRMVFYAAVEAFLAKYLGGQAEAPRASESCEAISQ